jgi:hypothetical protein
MDRALLSDGETPSDELTKLGSCIVGKPESAGINRHVVGDERARAAMLADVPVGESPIGGSAQLPP